MSLRVCETETEQAVCVGTRDESRILNEVTKSQKLIVLVFVVVVVW